MSDPHEIIPISFSMQEVHDEYWKLKTKKYFVQTRSQTKIGATVLPKEHGTDIGLDPNLRPEVSHNKGTNYTITIICSHWVKRRN